MHNLDLSFDEILEDIFDEEDLETNENNVKKFCDNILIEN